MTAASGKMQPPTPSAPGLEGSPRGHGFGTAPVFLASVSTILGAIMFLRFGYAVGNLGLLGAIGLILVAHLVTIPTAMAIAEIATNRRVEGGGEYYIITGDPLCWPSAAIRSSGWRTSTCPAGFAIATASDGSSRGSASWRTAR